MGWQNEDFTLISVSAGAGFTGVFVYSPVPGLNNLKLSIAPQAGTDPYGNAYNPILEVYGSSPVGQGIILNVAGGIAVESFPTGSASELSAAQLKSGTIALGGAAEQQVVTFSGAENSNSSDAPFIQFSSSPHNQTNQATGFLVYHPASGSDQPMVAWGALGVSRYTLAGMNGGLPLTQMDSFQRTVTTSGFQQITNAYSIPANDPVLAGGQQTIYEINAIGFGTWPAPTQVLGFQGLFLGLAMIALNVPGGTAGDGFNWELRYRAVILTTGVAGTCRVSGWASFRDASTGASYFTGPIVDSNAETINTTVAGSFQLQAGWALGGAGATMTCVESVFTRTGS